MKQTNKEIKVKRGKFINRELTQIDFNRRVLDCANLCKNPINERLKFLAITGSNIDEFIAVRLAGVYNEMTDDTSVLETILRKLRKFKKDQENCYNSLVNEMKKKGVFVTKVSKLNKKAKEKIKEKYLLNIFPLLTPINVSNCNDIPNIKSGTTCVVITFKHDGIEDVVILPIDTFDMFYRVDEHNIVMTEDIIMTFMGDTMFINKEIIDTGVFRIIKDASMVLSHDENKFIVDRMNDILLERKQSSPVYIELTKDTPERLVNILMNIFKVPCGHYFNSSTIIDYRRFFNPIFDDSMSYEQFSPFIYENSENYYSLFEALQHEDILLHHPYDSYDTIVKFIQHAAYDKQVVSIKQTLYRVSGIDSPIVNALCDAAKSGKKVTVLIEIKARFDEENNIHLIDKLKAAGANVILGFEYLKTHCKMCIVIRKENDKLKFYSHVGTGNYNEKTSKLYTDISYLTSKQKIGTDLLHIFNILSGYSSPDEKLQKIFYSPVTLRKNIIKCINREIENVKKGKKGEIFMKMNSLSDPIMVDKLYEAADKGVNVYIVCRGICSIVPRKNLYIKSIVGRFLEHSRIYYFKNGKNSEYYISSADLLTRNLDKRVETMISLKDSNVIEMLKWMIKVFKLDEANSFEMNPSGNWIRKKGDFSCHDWFIQYSDIKKEKKKWRK